MTGKEFKAARKGLGLTQTDVAALVGRTVWAVRNWEQGKSPVPGYAVTILRFRNLVRQNGGFKCID
jgi:DNA-binding transcriptional regulator YiaG